jgi:hypothetical protein
MWPVLVDFYFYFLGKNSGNCKVTATTTTITTTMQQFLF